MSPEGAVPISTQRPRLATLAPSWPVDQAAVPTSERSHTDSLLQTSNRSHRQARVWRETQSRKETRQVKYENKRSTEQMGMAYPISKCSDQKGPRFGSADFAQMILISPRSSS